MSKKIKVDGRSRRLLRLAACAACALVLLCAPQRISAQKAGPERQAAVNPQSVAVVAATEEVLRETSELRKLAVLRPVKSGAQTRAEIERMIVRNLNEETRPEEMRASELTLKKLGLAPADFQLRSFIVELLTEQVAGYYNPKTQEFYLADWIDVDGQKPVIAHELTHALQDQHFNLRRFDKWPKGDSDAELAAHALIEGDATLLMTHYIMRNPLRALAMFRALGASSSSNEKINSAPRALRESLLFPYEHGAGWAAQVYRRGGWEMISQAFRELPQSTEQILHVEKYFAREAPLPVSVPDIAPLLGAQWRRLDYDVNGEWSLYLILDEYLKSVQESRKAAAGWGGDRYVVYEEPRTKAVLVVQLIDWDTEEDAAEFFDAYAKRTTLRYAKARPLNSPRTETTAAVERVWQTTEGRVHLERRGRRVLVLEGMPEQASTRELLKSIWQ